ncbi:MAG TPA: hypothetical protein VE545_09425, partial [Candidatus Dormibacteraeota bacterium]|nr:hypothetical protein [Candidatus Dormibacteraeota bacterium]
RNGIGGLPGARFIFEKRKFDGEAILVRLDKAIYAARVGVNDAADFGVHLCDVALGGAIESEGTKTLVDGKRSVPENFGELTERGTAKEIHLPQAILGHDVAFGFDHVFYGAGVDVWDAPNVAFDGDVLLQAKNLNGTVKLREGAINEPPGNAANEQQHQGD